MIHGVPLNLFSYCALWLRDWFRINPLEILLLGTNALINGDVAKRDVSQYFSSLGKEGGGSRERDEREGEGVEERVGKEGGGEREMKGGG